MSSILYRCIKTFGALFKSEIGSNFSFHSASDFVKKVKERIQKYPALVIRSTKFEPDLRYRSMNPIITKNLQNGTYTEESIPDIFDVYFKCVLFTEGNIEGLETISKLISFFSKYTSIDINDKELTELVGNEQMTYKTYNISLISTEEDNEDNSLDISKYEIIFFVEGLEFTSGIVSSGQLVSSEHIDIIPI